MKRILLWIGIVMLACVGLWAWSILNNTKPSLVLAPQQITSAASSSAISLKGYERAHLLILTKLATSVDTLRVDVYKAASASATFTVAQTATFTGATTGYLEFEIVKDMGAPYIKIKFTPSATLTAGAVLVLYGHYSSPF